jgi:hypothetical protein
MADHYVPESKGEILDMLGFMMLSSPTFTDDSGYFPDRNIETVFVDLNQGLLHIRRRLGEEKYLALAEMSARMKTHFEADPNDENGECLAGRELILDMIDILKGRKHKDTAEG